MKFPLLSGLSRLPLAVTSSLRTKLLAIFAVLAVIPLSVVGVVSYSKSFSTIQGGITASTLQIADQLKKNIELLFLDTEKLLKIGDHPATIRFLNPYRQSEEGTYRSALEIIQLFKLFRGIYDYGGRVRGIHILGFNGNHISEREGRFTLDRRVQDLPTVRRILRHPGEVVHIPNEEVDHARTGYRDVISVGRAIIRPATREVLGVIIVDVSQEAVVQLCRTIRIGETGHFSIVNPDWRFIYPPGQRVTGGELSPANLHRVVTGESGSFIESGRGPKELFVFATVARNGWKIVGRVKLQEILRSAYEIRNITLSVVLLCMLFIVVLFFFISGALTHPLRDLKEKMAQAERGDLEVRAVASNRDEIADLCHSFNVMIGKIKELLESSLREHENLKKYELKALQAQINPHFLYNTLDAIVWMAEANNREQVVRMTKTLSSFFRIVLSKGEEWIGFRSEVDHVESYLAIQKIRYRDILDYELDFAEELFECRILKLTLQPLVENAIYHGIKNSRGGGCVRVSGRLEDGEMRLEVADDGGGIPPDRLREVREGLAESTIEVNKGPGYGLKNVNQRIRLYYGPEWGLSIDSTPGRGTLVTVRIPATRQVAAER